MYYKKFIEERKIQLSFGISIKKSSSTQSK